MPFIFLPEDYTENSEPFVFYCELGSIAQSVVQLTLFISKSKKLSEILGDDPYFNISDLQN